MTGLPYFDLRGKVAVITGGAAGIGRGIAGGLAEAGADIVISEELEGGIEMGRALMQYLQIPEDETEKLIHEIRAFGSADFF